MIHKFNVAGIRAVLDTESDKVNKVSELAYKMLDYIVPPMGRDCPVSIRYDMAKYPATAVDAAYGELFALYSAGELFSSHSVKSEASPDEPTPHESDAVISFGADDPYFSDKVARLADEGKKYIIALPDETIGEEVLPDVLREYSKVAKEIVKRRENGSKNTFDFLPFDKRKASVPKQDGICADCPVRKYCERPCPDDIGCAIEKRLAECALALKLAERSR